MATTPYSVPTMRPLTRSWTRSSVFMAALPFSFRGREGVRRLARREVYDREGGADALSGAVLEADDRVDVDGRSASVDGADDVVVFLGNDAAAHLAGPGELVVVGVELLVEEKEPGDALTRWQRGIHCLDLPAH